MRDFFDDTELLSISDDNTATEFQIATHQAVVNNDSEFLFHGYVIETSTAIDVVQEILAQRTYH